MTSNLKILLSDIKVSHTIFAMPFALLSAFMAASSSEIINWTIFTYQILLIILCMFFARNFAMTSNRLTDSNIDLHNPRTKNRAIPSGQVSKFNAKLFKWINGIAFVLCTYTFNLFSENLLPLQFSVFVLIWLELYAYMKRFTWLCHLYLGSSLALSPICVVIAISPEYLQNPSIWLLSGAVMCWVAGFDIIYALQDIDADQRDNIKSMPASLGIKRSMQISQTLHCICILCLCSIYLINDQFGNLYIAAVIFSALILTFEHLTVKKWGTTKIAITFFTLNGIISIALGSLGIIDLLL